MEKLGSPDTHYLSSALGWLELGNRAEARLEWARINPEARRLPEVLEVGWLIQAAEKDWAGALETARALIATDPDRSFGWLHQAYALRRVPEGGIRAAWNALLPVVERFPKEPTIPYNLACYACQMGWLDEARKWLRQAQRRGDKTAIKAMALADIDLEALWSEIRDW